MQEHHLNKTNLNTNKLECATEGCNQNEGCNHGCTCSGLRGGTLATLFVVLIFLIGGLLLAQHIMGGDDQEDQTASNRVGAGAHAGVEVLATQAALTEKVTGSKQPVLVVFSATRCSACRKYEPHFEKAAAQLGDRAGFFKVDADRTRPLAIKHRIQYLPTTVVFRNGKETTRFTGVKDGAELAALVAE